MPVYLFTFHAYGSWLPDNPRGYVRRKEGIQPQDVPLGQAYREAMRESPQLFDAPQQHALIELTLQAMPFIESRLHAAATEPTHLHALVSWQDETRTWLRQRTSIKRALTIGLKKSFSARTYFSDSASRKQVQDQTHFDHLVKTYLPDHGGWKWDEARGFFQ